MDSLEILNSGFHSYNEGNTSKLARQLPVLGLLKDYRDFATGNNPNNPREEAIQGLTLTGTVW